MERVPSRTTGWLGLATAVLIIGGIFGIVDGLMAVYKASFFSATAQYLFSGLSTWGWMVFGLGVASVLSGLAIAATRQEWARWTGVVVASLAFLAQMMFAQAYPLWSLIMVGVYGAVIYGLIAHGEWASAAAASTPREVPGTGGTATGEIPSERRAA